MKVLQVSKYDGGGGAHLVANSLHQGLRARGHRSAMAVGVKLSDDPDVIRIPSGVSQARLRAYRVARRIVRPFARRIPSLRPLRLALKSPHPRSYLQTRAAGREMFDYPGSRRILELGGFLPDIVHLHNLHSNYFDLRFLAELSHSVPVAMTLHDEWTYTGHCAHTLVGDRWKEGCRSCPDLDVYPAIERDATHDNWLAKQQIYLRSRLYVSAPSKWILDRARQSILSAATVDWKHIPNGVDIDTFRPRDRAEARAALGLPQDVLMLLFSGNFLNTNSFKDYRTIEAAMEQLAGSYPDRPLLLVALGGDQPPRRVGNAEIRQVPYEYDPARVAGYYHAADVYLHAANADTFPTTVIEAMAAGRPVIATAVGGIPEQVQSLRGAAGAWGGSSFAEDEATGILVDAHDAVAMAAAASTLLSNDLLRRRLGANAASLAAINFDLERQVGATVAWYGDVIDDWTRWRQRATARLPAN